MNVTGVIGVNNALTFDFHMPIALNFATDSLYGSSQQNVYLDDSKLALRVAHPKLTLQIVKKVTSIQQCKTPQFETHYCETGL